MIMIILMKYVYYSYAVLDVFLHAWNSVKYGHYVYDFMREWLQRFSI